MNMLIYFITLISYSIQHEIKNVLVFCFPGGKSHTFVFRELFEYTSTRLEEENRNIRYNFTILAHNSDADLWETPRPNINVIGFGEVSDYEEKFQKAMEMGKEDPIFGYGNFNKAMVHVYYDFLRGNTLQRLKGMKFDLMMCDVINFLTLFLRIELNIPMKLYLNPTCVYTIINEVYEYNASYMPMLGTTFSEKMNFFQRLFNQIYLWGTRLMYRYFKYLQTAVFKEYGFYYDMDPFPKDAFYMNQCVTGLHYPSSLPPNVINIGAVLPKPSSPLSDKQLDSFLSKYKQNIYISQGTITKALHTESLLEVFRRLPDIGFVLSLKREMLEQLRDIPTNVLGLSWVEQNNLLGDSRLTAFVTHGGLNSILESIYHAKPMIAIGTTLDQVNGATAVGYRKYGISITDKLTADKLEQSIKEILSNKIYTEKVREGSRYVKHFNGKETFYYWFNYIIENGYDHLLVRPYAEWSFIELNHIDVIICLVMVSYVITKLIIWTILWIKRKFFNSKQV